MISVEGCEAHARCGAGYYRGKLGRVLAVGFGSGGSDGRVDGWNLDRGGGGWLGSAKNEGEQCIWRAGRIAWWTLDRGGGGALEHMELILSLTEMEGGGQPFTGRDLGLGVFGSSDRNRVVENKQAREVQISNQKSFGDVQR